MKRILSTFVLSALAGFSFAQESFHKDSRNFDIKLDLAVFNGTVSDNYFPSEQSIGAASVIIAPQMSWAVGRSISLGGSLAFSHYLDSSSTSGQLSGLDGNFLFDIHFLRRPKTDMMIGLKLGIAGLRLDPDDGTGDVYGSMGGTADVHWMARFYVSEKIAILASLCLPSYTFNKFGKNLNDTYTIKLRGFAFGTGIAFKLPNQRTSGSQRG